MRGTIRRLAARNPTHASRGRVAAAEGVPNFGSNLSRLAIPWVVTPLLDAMPTATTPCQ